MRQIALYVHIPFCKSKCPYCDFVSFENHENLIDDYIESVCREITSFAEEDIEVKSVFFGGGTPNLMTSSDIEKILNSATLRFLLTNNAEISIEINPEFANEKLFNDYLNIGINRLSIGVQSFDDVLLRKLGRIHDAKQSIRAYEEARLAGFKNLNIDLIYGIPGQTLTNWESDLNTINNLKPEHISVYPLTVSNSCKWGKTGIGIEQDEDLTADMYKLACDYLPAIGLSQYEISNFSKNAFECKHNLAYWKCEEYLGIGVGAHSLMDNMRYENTRSIPEYIEKIKNNEQTATLKTKLSPEDIQSEIIFMNLRLNNGLNINEYEEKTGDNFLKSYKPQIASLLNDGMLSLKDRKISLTDKARPIANEVFCNFV